MADQPQTTRDPPCRYACEAFPNCGCEVEALSAPALQTTAERIARAWDPVGWAWCDNAADDHPAKPSFLADQMLRAERVLRELHHD